MHMIDVMNKLKEIAESGYDNEDIQRGIDAAATQKFDEVRGKIHENVSDDIKLSAQKLAQVAGNKTAELMIKIVTDAKEKFPQLKGKDTLVGGVPQHQHELVSFLDNLRKEVDNAIAEKSIDGFERRSYEYMGNLKELGLDLGVYKLFNRIEAMLEESIAEAEKEKCRYCGGDCPNDEDNACDGYLGDIDGLYDVDEAVTEEEAVEEDAVEEADVFEDSTNQVMEGTWALPETEEDMAKLRELMSKPLPCGPDGEYASEQLYSLIGDDKLFDNIGELADKDPDADCREIVKARAKELGVEIDVEEVHEDVEEDTSLADMLKLAGRSGVMGLSENNIIAESLELDEEDDLEEAYINTYKDAIDTLGELRKIGKSIETGQGEYEGNLANKYANDVYDVISWVENNLNKYEPNYKKVEGPVIELLKKAKGLERQAGSGKDARFGNEIVNTLYPLMQWIEMNAHGSGVKEVEEEAIDEAEVELDEAEVEETVEVPVAALEELMRLAGYENYEAKIDEYENEPEEEYTDIEDQLIGLSGGLNGPKKAYAAAAGGDNAMAQEPTEVEEDTLSFESFYKKYQEFVTEEK